MAVTRIWFIRHGEVEDGHVGTFTGATDVGLSDVGRHQAQALATLLQDADVDAIVASPMRRALDTATPTAAARGLDLDIREDLREMDFGHWETKTWEQILVDDPGGAAEFQAGREVRFFPGGEDTDGFAARVGAAFDGIVADYTGQSVAVFSHAGTNRGFLSRLTGLPYLDCFVFAQDYGCANAAAWDDEAQHGQLALLNLVPGPRSENHGDGGRKVA